MDDLSAALNAGGYMRSRKDSQSSSATVELEQRAWRNRRVPTESEERLWQALRGCKLGVQFRRQVPLAGRYINCVAGLLGARWGTSCSNNGPDPSDAPPPSPEAVAGRDGQARLA